MPGDPKACREHARRCAELAVLAATPEERSTSYRSKALGLALPLSLRVPRHFSRQWTRSILSSLTHLRRPEQ